MTVTAEARSGSEDVWLKTVISELDAGILPEKSGFLTLKVFLIIIPKMSPL